MSIPRFVAGLLFVAAMLVFGTDLAAAVTQEYPPELAVQERVEQLADPSAEERKRAREELRALGAVAVLPLILATESPDAHLRWEGVNLLGSIGDLRATDAVLRVAMTDADAHARWRSNWAITNLDDGTVVPRLVAALDHEDPTVAWNSAITLSLFGETTAVSVLHGGLDAAGWRQWEAVNALGRVWNTETVPQLRRILCEGSDDVRSEAVLSLGRIGGGEALEALLDVLSADPSPDVRWRAAMMIGLIGNPATINRLETAKETETDSYVVQHIEEAIREVSTR